MRDRELIPASSQPPSRPGGGLDGPRPGGEFARWPSPCWSAGEDMWGTIFHAAPEVNASVTCARYGVFLLDRRAEELVLRVRVGRSGSKPSFANASDPYGLRTGDCGLAGLVCLPQRQAVGLNLMVGEASPPLGRPPGSLDACLVESTFAWRRSNLRSALLHQDLRRRWRRCRRCATRGAQKHANIDARPPFWDRRWQTSA